MLKLRASQVANCRTQKGLSHKSRKVALKKSAEKRREKKEEKKKRRKEEK
jgi:hypothetical protein